ncbi:MAG: dihydropteroate synthase [Betaproteobacteria bacterium]|nr:dihydropteroate synthase [Betaproteobacteria bacterium]
MGIVNVTPDSFSDGGKFLGRDQSIAHARKLIEDGADIVDIGGESTRPGAAAAGLQEELDRVMPVLEALRDAAVPVSIDTQKTEVMKAAIAAGAAMINDVNALQAEGAVETCAASSVAVCLMHKQGTPQTMQQNPVYGDVVAEVKAFLLARADACRHAGIAGDRIVVDPGFGFGKTVQHNFELLRQLSSLTSGGYAVLAGYSRKSSLGAVTGRPVEERLAASLAAALIAVQNGATILRVHDVRETVDVLKVWRAASGKDWG